MLENIFTLNNHYLHQKWYSIFDIDTEIFKLELESRIRKKAKISRIPIEDYMNMPFRFTKV